MRKIAVYFVLVFALLSAQNIMKMDSTQIAVNDTGILSIYIDNNDPFVGFQCDLDLPEAITMFDVALTDRSVNHSLTLIDQGENNYQVIVYSINNTPFIGNNGKVIDLFLVADSSPGNYDVILDSAIIGNASAENILTGSESGSVEIIDTLTTEINRGSIIPNDYEIKINNYPNPFNPGTVIKYELNESSFVELCIYDAKGKKISTLFQGYQSKGDYEFSWDGQNYPSGIYYAQLSAGEKVSYCKLIFVK